MPPERILALSLPEFDTARGFAPVFAQLTDVVPEIEQLQPGLVIMLARGPARFYGGEVSAASALMSRARDAGATSGRVGIADGRFAAVLAATLTPSADTAVPVSAVVPADTAVPENAADDTAAVPPWVTVVPPGASAEFLAGISVAHIGDDHLSAMLPRLGLYTLGTFAALPEEAVRERFGPNGVRALLRARGVDREVGESVRPDIPEEDLTFGIDFELPIAGTEQLAFACSALTEQLSTRLLEAGCVCTTLRVTLRDENGFVHAREWSHPRFFSSGDMLARIRWQAEALQALGDAELSTDLTGAGIDGVRLFPVHTDRAVNHDPGLWSTGVDDRVHHHVSRAQSLLGPSGVGTMTLEGGRLLRDRQRFTPWAVAEPVVRGAGPWPGAVSAPTPSLVFPSPLRAFLRDAAGAVVQITEDDLLSAPPATLQVERFGSLGRVRGWSRPWPIRERWWEGRPERFRVQLELDTGDAWVLLAQRRAVAHRETPGISLVSGGSTGVVVWFAEGRYD